MVLTTFSQLYAALTNELGKRECVCSPREVKLLLRLKCCGCQAAQSRASHQLKHPCVRRALLRVGFPPAGEGELRDARLPTGLRPCSSALLWAEGGPAAWLGQLPLEGCSSFIPLPLFHFFFLLEVGKLQQGSLGKD